ARQILFLFHIIYLTMPVFFGGIGDKLAGDALYGFFARGIHIGDDTHFRIEERKAKLFVQLFGSGVQMWLKNSHQAPVFPSVASRAKRSLNLRWMMSVIIDDQHSIVFCFKLEAAEHALKTFQTGLDLGKSNIQFQSYSNRSQSIFHIMFAGSLKLDAAQLTSFLNDGKGAVEMICFYIRSSNLGLWRQSIADRPAINFRDD